MSSDLSIQHVDEWMWTNFCLFSWWEVVYARNNLYMCVRVCMCVFKYAIQTIFLLIRSIYLLLGLSPVSLAIFIYLSLSLFLFYFSFTAYSLSIYEYHTQIVKYNKVLSARNTLQVRFWRANTHTIISLSKNWLWADWMTRMLMIETTYQNRNGSLPLPLNTLKHFIWSYTTIRFRENTQINRKKRN